MKSRDNIYLENLLKQKSFSLHMLSKASGVAYGTVYNLFTGRKPVENIRASCLKRLADCLELSMDEFYDALKQEAAKELSGAAKGAPIRDFTLLWKDEPIADVRIVGNNAIIERYVQNPAKQIVFADTIPLLTFGEIIRSRCWEQSRPDIAQLLHFINLPEFDPYRIVAKTHGLTAQDPLWFRFKGEKLNYNQVRRIRFATGDYAAK